MKKYRKSHNVTIADSLVAASARVHSFSLWTLNKKRYPMFKSDEFIE
jgi:predicted nucleic acid-binding protein